jgi:hypothetical protein
VSRQRRAGGRGDCRNLTCCVGVAGGSAGNRVFGHINVEGENLASKIVAAGWAKVKAMGNNGNGNANANGTKGVHAAYIEELLQVNPKP